MIRCHTQISAYVRAAGARGQSSRGSAVGTAWALFTLLPGSWWGGGGGGAP